jgi:taurine dioxygenase
VTTVVREKYGWHPVGRSRILGRSNAIVESDHFDIRPLQPTIGAEISGVSLREAIPGGLARDLRRALLEWKVLIFPNQHLSSQQHVDLAHVWGEPLVLPIPDKGDAPEVTLVVSGPGRPGTENVWHSDGSGDETPSSGSILRAVEVPARGVTRSGQTWRPHIRGFPIQ